LLYHKFRLNAALRRLRCDFDHREILFLQRNRLLSKREQAFQSGKEFHVEEMTGDYS